MATNNTTQNSTIQNQVIVVMIPLPAQGHLNPLLRLSHLISAYEIPVHFIGTAIHNRQAKTRVHGWNPLSNPNIIFHDFTVPGFQNPGPNPKAPTKCPTQLLPSFHAALNLRDPISKLLIDLSTTAKRVVVIHDYLMRYTAQDVSTIQNTEAYCFHVCSVFHVYSSIWEMAGKPNIPEAHFFEKLPSYESCFDPAFIELMKFSSECKILNSGNLYNTCKTMEGRFLDLLIDKNWAIGPFNPILISDEKASRHKCMEWLDKQSTNSVIFVSFGSTTSFTEEEINEIVVGLEKSGQKFIWVLREADKGDVFRGESTSNTLLLPEGYEERIKDRGIIIRDWAPQLAILGHSSTGGFVSHCGWNSCIESISMGVPIAAWPMHSDQPRNAILVTDVLKIGIVVRDWDNKDEVVKAETIEKVVRRLMDSSEGDEIRKNAAKLSEDVKESVTEGGESHKELESFIAYINR